MKSFLKHIFEQPFVFATGLAALAHSTWALATLFTGEEPHPQFSGAWFAWVIPAFLIAFAMDVGQIVTSAEIRSGQRTFTKYVTFGVFALATYFLQWLYIVHHIPALDLADGVRADWSEMVTTIRDLAIFIIPALLPASTLLYTFSSQHHEQPQPPFDAPHDEQPHDDDDAPIESQNDVRPHEIDIVDDEQAPFDAPALPPQIGDEFVLSSNPKLDELHTVVCESCGWTYTHANKKSATNAKNAHTRFCIKNKATQLNTSILPVNS